MTSYDAERYIQELYIHLLKRPPGSRELAAWKESAATRSPLEILNAFTSTKEYLSKSAVASTFTPGHYHSPVVDPTTVHDYYKRSKATLRKDLQGIHIDMDRMQGFWADNLSVTLACPFTMERTAQQRYFSEGGPYPLSDAVTLRMMMAAHRPKRIMEIGSGFSTACMLDTADECGLDDLQITCIEPYPDRLHSLMRDVDYARVTIRSSGVQDVPIADFDILEAGDILFIDSTHVLKTGSDVHYELFSILPRLKPGVLVHVHDIQFPFEYPPKWVFDLNYSWNEIYALRAFLMYNARFEILFWNSFAATHFREKILQDYPKFLTNPGSSIWLLSCPLPMQLA